MRTAKKLKKTLKRSFKTPNDNERTNIKKITKKNKNVNATLKPKLRRGGSKSSFKSELADLAEQDPDFFEYLKNEEADILDFSDEDENGDDENDKTDDYGDVGSSDSDEAEDESLDEDSRFFPANMRSDNNDKKDNDKEERKDEGASDNEDDFGGELLVDDEESSLSRTAVKVEELRSGKKLFVKIRRDGITRKKLVDALLTEYLSVVLADPVQHRPALAKAVHVAVDCFKACVCGLGGGEENIRKPIKQRHQSKGENTDDTFRAKNAAVIAPITSEFVVKQEQIFDEVLQICFTHIGRSLMILLNPIEKNGLKKKMRRVPKRLSATTFKHWHKYGALARQYLNALCSLLSELQHNEEVITEGLNAVSAIVDLYLHFPKTSKQLIKTVVRLWSRKNKSVQSAAFIVLCKFVRLDAEASFALIYRHCYLAYIANSKQVNTDTKPIIEFMQKCFAELSFLAPKLAYDYAFVYVRQYAIHLRTAIIGKKKDLIPTVYNWQFLNGLSLWTIVVAQSASNPAHSAWFADLHHPIVEIISLLKRSFMSSKYVPLGIFCVRILLRMQIGCRIFIPTLAMSIVLLDQLLQIDKTKPTAGKGSQKAVDVTGTVRFSKLQLQDAGVRAALADELYRVCSDCADALKQHPAFPEILVPLEMKLKNFIKKCRNSEHSELFKLLNRKLRDQAAKISAIVAARSIDLSNYEIGGKDDIFNNEEIYENGGITIVKEEKNRKRTLDTSKGSMSKKFKFK